MQMLFPLTGIDNVNGLLATLQTFFDEWKQHTIFFFVAREECTNMADRAKLRAC